jgi:hypothetical protein
MGVVPTDPLPEAAVVMFGGTLTVTGGTLVSGTVMPPDPASTADGPSVLTFDTDINVTGGDFSEGIATVDSTARIRGGTLGILVFLNTLATGCSEIRGGQLDALAVLGGRVIVAGTGLSLTPVAGTPGASLLSGTLENGQPVSAAVLAQQGGMIQFVPPNGAGCP